MSEFKKRLNVIKFSLTETHLTVNPRWVQLASEWTQVYEEKESYASFIKSK
jgi:hypothetical protein